MPVTRRDSTTPSLDKSTEAGSLAEPRALIVTTIEASMRRGRDDQRPARPWYYLHEQPRHIAENATIYKQLDALHP